MISKIERWKVVVNFDNNKKRSCQDHSRLKIELGGRDICYFRGRYEMSHGSSGAASQDQDRVYRVLRKWDIELSP